MQAKVKWDNTFVRVIKGALFGAAISLLLILLFSLGLYKEWIPIDSISAINTGIKVISAVGASLVSVRKSVKHRWLVGGFSGFAYAAIAYLVFSILAKSYTVSAALLSDLGMGMLAGMLAAMIRQLVK